MSYQNNGMIHKKNHPWLVWGVLILVAIVCIIGLILVLRGKQKATIPTSNDPEGITAVHAKLPASAVKDMTANQFMEGDAHWNWWNEYREKSEASAKLQPELRTYYPTEALRQRIDMARKQDVLSHAIITIGILGNEKIRPLSPEDLEDQVRQIKRLAPEMPGLSVYGSTKKMENRDLLFFADQLCGKYYVSPVLTLLAEAVQMSDPSPMQNTKVRIRGTVMNVGGMDSGPVTVRFYDGNPANGGERIGEKRIEKVDSLRDGTDFPKGASVEIDWTARRQGTHEIYMEILPENLQDTLLDHLACRAIMVR